MMEEQERLLVTDVLRSERDHIVRMAVGEQEIDAAVVIDVGGHHAERLPSNLSISVPCPACVNAPLPLLCHNTLGVGLNICGRQ